jgi:hypothetical protein
MSATHVSDSTTATAPVLYLALEPSWTSWKLAFTVGPGQKPGLRSIAARDIDMLMLDRQDCARVFHDDDVRAEGVEHRAGEPLRLENKTGPGRSPQFRLAGSQAIPSGPEPVRKRATSASDSRSITAMELLPVRAM